MGTSTTEERLAALEKDMAEVKEHLATKRPGVIGRTRPDFLTNYTRRSANSPLFDEVMREIEAQRHQERFEAERRNGVEETAG